MITISQITNQHAATGYIRFIVCFGTHKLLLISWLNSDQSYTMFKKNEKNTIFW